ncbi:MAG: MBL fold metallo-hydrolase [Bacteroidetes bacterium HGW-Bacteroidetes-13]|nr:MAG: MBL fold metallo-hydrolase [Bacteroidetes bacterium HGW-Bacteroidetes-13]
MKRISFLSFAMILFYSQTGISQNQDVTIKVTAVTDQISMLVGQGGNIGLLVGEKKALMIDDQFAPLTGKILDAVKTVTDKPVSYLLNTHWHGDHTGGNANMSQTGALIFAHENVRKRLENAQREKNELIPNALPNFTFTDQMNFFFEDEEIMFLHSHNGHTDGDAMVYFVQNNVLHTGDLYFQGRYPFMDLNSGGSVSGYIEAVRKALMLINDDTKIIPGHGNLSNKKEYLSFLEMLEYLHSNISQAIASGKSEAEIVADTSLTEKYDKLGYGSGFINSEKIRQTFYTSLRAK